MFVLIQFLQTFTSQVAVGEGAEMIEEVALVVGIVTVVGGVEAAVGVVVMVGGQGVLAIVMAVGVEVSVPEGVVADSQAAMEHRVVQVGSVGEPQTPTGATQTKATDLHTTEAPVMEVDNRMDMDLKTKPALAVQQGTTCIVHTLHHLSLAVRHQCLPHPPCRSTSVISESSVSVGQSNSHHVDHFVMPILVV